MNVLINDWAIMHNMSGYLAPELREPRLVGEITEHPNWHGNQGPQKFDPPKRMVSSRLESAEGRVVTTRNGTRYELGTINPEYKEWLAEHHPGSDPDEPFGFLTEGKDDE